MARIKLGALVTDISGSIGMATIQRNRFGHTLRLKPLPKLSQTRAQYVIRRFMIKVQAAWQALNSAQRLQWERFIDFSGQTILKDKSVSLSGHALYLKYNVWLLLIGEDIIETIQYLTMPDYPDLTHILFHTGEHWLKFDDTVLSAEFFFICKLSSTRLPSKAFSFNGLRFMRVAYGEDTQYSIDIPYRAAFGVLPSVGDKLHYSIHWFSTLSPVYSGVFTGIIEVTLP